MAEKHLEGKSSWDTPERRAFGANIKEARLTRFVSQEAFAAALRVAAPYISQIEAGRRIPSDGLLCAMAKAVPEAADWAALRIKAHRLRSPHDLAALVVAPPDPTPGISNDQIFQRLRFQLEHSDLPAERRAKLIEGWLEEIKLVRERLGADARGPKRLARGSSR